MTVTTVDETSEEMVERVAGELYGAEGVTFEVVAKVRAVRESDEKIVETLIEPILLYRGYSLYRAMFIMASACQVKEFIPDPAQLGPAAEQVVAELRAGKFKWTKAKGG
jgi:hypothetical protein